MLPNGSSLPVARPYIKAATCCGHPGTRSDADGEPWTGQRRALCRTRCYLQPGACALCSLPASCLQVLNVAGKKGLTEVGRNRMPGRESQCPALRGSLPLCSHGHPVLCLFSRLLPWVFVLLDCCIVVPILPSQLSEITYL